MVKLDPSFLGISIVDRISMLGSIGMMEWNCTLLLCRRRKHLTKALAFFPVVKLDPSFLGISIVGWIDLVDRIGIVEWNYTLLLC